MNKELLEKKADTTVSIGRPPKAPRPGQNYEIAKKKINPMAEVKKTAQGKNLRTQVKPGIAKPQKVETLVSEPKRSVQTAPKPQPVQRAAAQQKAPQQPVQTQTLQQTKSVQQTKPAQQAKPVLQKPVQQKNAQQTAQRTIPQRPENIQAHRKPIFEPEQIVDPRLKKRRKAAVNGGTMQYAERPSAGKTVLRGIAMFMACLLTFVCVLAGTLLISIKMICGDTSPAAKELFVTTLLETGQFKSLATLFLPDDEVQRIVDDNTMEIIDEEVDSTLIQIDPAAGEDNSETPAIEVKEISGSTFFGTLLIIKDPSKVSVATIYPWAAEGKPLDVIVNDAGAVAGINGGLYNSTNNSGGSPYGVVVSNGEILYNEPEQFDGFVLIGFTEENILEIIPIDGYSKADIEALVAEKKIRDAVTFQEEASDKNNHFVQLVINGEAREMNGMGSGLNPRTAIGQRADGAIIMLVTDGRGKEGHLGASAADLINIMVENGAINAANLDGGSSSCMYHDGEYLMDSVTFYQANTSWNLPLAFVVKN